VFAWQMLLGRVQTRLNLRKRGVLVDNDVVGETEEHRFGKGDLVCNFWVV